jgi:hypothetical protein
VMNGVEGTAYEGTSKLHSLSKPYNSRRRT